MLGGLVALRLKDQMHLILGFSAGAVIAVAFFDLLPEAIDLAQTTYATSSILALAALGFAAYLVLDRSIFFHGHGSEEDHSHDHTGGSRDSAGAGALSIHSFLDGIGIGLAFQVAPAVGIIVAAAVLTHDFSDGINTVSIVLRHGGERKRALKWLFVDAIAPVLGVIATLFFAVPPAQLGMLLALFAGFFLYIGATDLIPESYHGHPVAWTTVATIAGMGTLYTIIQLAGA